MKKIILMIVVLVSSRISAQPGTDIYLFDMKVSGSMITLSNPENITHRKGYDNQPFFSPIGPLIYYTSAVDTLGNTDIKTYDYLSKKTTFFTNTPEGEYSPTVTPDKKFISCIFGKNVGKKNVTQFLVKYPIAGGAKINLIDNRVIGYHTWIDNNRLFLFVLGDSGRNSLHYYNLLNKEDKFIVKDPGRALQKIPGEDEVAFIDKSDSNNVAIKKINTHSFKIDFVSKLIGKGEFVTWINKDLLIITDGKEIFFKNLKENLGWQKINNVGPHGLLKGITRLAVNPEHTKMAVVASDQ